MKTARPEKICPACGRPFAWRRKWAKTWDEVKYCSAACREGRYERAKKDALALVRPRAVD
nr:DUF2256 domain-containing protein [uncultured Acidocella sp.]